MRIKEMNESTRALIGALTALAEAVFGVEYKITDETRALVRAGLTADNDSAERLLPLVRAEKDRTAPDCKTCTHPCGRTAEFDVTTLRSADPVLRRRKLLLLESLRASAQDSVDTEKLFEGLRAFGEDYTSDALIPVLKSFGINY